MISKYLRLMQLTRTHTVIIANDTNCIRPIENVFIDITFVVVGEIALMTKVVNKD